MFDVIDLLQHGVHRAVADVSVARGFADAPRLLTVWTHACIGIHYWLRTKRWYPNWRPFLFAYGLLLPTLALAGYVTGGNQVLREAKADPDFVNPRWTIPT